MAEIALTAAIAKLKNLDNAILKALETDVADGFKQAISDGVDKRVYDAYEPKSDIYERRRDNGGLSDVRNYETKAEGGNGEYTLRLHNTTPFQQFYGGTPPTYTTLTEVAESGNANFHHGPAPDYAGPRPFMDDGRDDFVNEGDAEKYLIQGLHKLGY